MLSFMVLVVVHSSQLYRKIHSANTLKWRIFCDKVRYLLLYTWLFSFMVQCTYGDHFSPLYVFSGVEQASK